MRIVDRHCHVSTTLYGPVDSLVHQMDRNGVEHAVLGTPLAPRFRSVEQATLNLGHRFSITPIEIATDVLFKRSTQLKALSPRAADWHVARRS